VPELRLHFRGVRLFGHALFYSRCFFHRDTRSFTRCMRREIGFLPLSASSLPFWESQLQKSQ
jgi:hypothetical protein